MYLCQQEEWEIWSIKMNKHLPLNYIKIIIIFLALVNFWTEKHLI